MPDSTEPAIPLQSETLNAIAASGVIRTFPRNSILINEGDVGDSLFIVLSGRVKVFASNEQGREFVIDFHGPGEYVGEMSLDGARALGVGGHRRADDLRGREPRAVPRVHSRASGLRAAPDRAADPPRPRGDRAT